MKHNIHFSGAVRILLTAAAAAFLLMPGCTPESPPLDLLLPPDTSEGSQNVSSAVSENEKSSAASDASSSQSSAISENKDISVTKDINGDLVEISFRYTDETPIKYYGTDEKDMLKKLSDALGAIKTGNETGNADGKNSLIILFTAKSSGRIEFEDGCYVKNGKKYETAGYEKLDTVLKEIRDKYPEWSKKYDEWIHRMSAAEDRIKELGTSDSYINADIEGKRKQALELLNQLTDEGLIKANSISDSGDMISYRINCSDEGVMGGIMLNEFDPMMN